MTTRHAIPTNGRDKKELLSELRDFGKADASWKGGKVFSLVYYAGEEFHDFLKSAHNAYFAENYLNPGAFKSLKRMESEVVEMTASMLHAPEAAVGTMTSGGTESLLMVVKAAKERALKSRPWLVRPEVVAPSTIHVAVDKACDYFGLKLKKADISDDMRADVASMKSLITQQTVLVMASAPQYPHGVIDPIEEIAAIASRKNLPFHVDGCLGGFVLPWVEKLGYPIPLWDFRVPGVTSISADLHKYGYAPKGSSVVVYRDMSYLRHQFFIATEWAGGVYASPTMQGTRAGGNISSAWAAMMAMGEDGYVQHTREAMNTATKLKQAISEIPELRVLGTPHATIVTYAARVGEGAIDIYAVADQLESRGWSVDRQQKPPSIHCTVTSNHARIMDEYIAALRESVAFAKAHPEISSQGNAATYGLVAKVPFRGMVKSTVLNVMESMYAPGGGDLDVTKGGDGPLDKLLERYRPQAMQVFDAIEKVKSGVKKARKRGLRR